MLLSDKKKTSVNQWRENGLRYVAPQDGSAMPDVVNYFIRPEGVDLSLNKVQYGEWNGQLNDDWSPPGPQLHMTVHTDE